MGNVILGAVIMLAGILFGSGLVEASKRVNRRGD